MLQGYWVTTPTQIAFRVQEKHAFNYNFQQKNVVFAIS